MKLLYSSPYFSSSTRISRSLTRLIVILLMALISLPVIGTAEDESGGVEKTIVPCRPKENPEFESPAEKFVENLPATKRLPKAPRARSVFVRAKPSLVVLGPTWTFVGPAPIPNGQTDTRSDPVSGRVSAIAVDPANANIAYVGTAQGGVYRTTDGGATWTPLMDNAVSPAGLVGTPLAIGAITIDPTNSSTILVGTGEGNLSADSFFGTGFYIITNANGASPTVSGPFNARASDGADIFTGRSIVAIAVDPANHNNVFCSTSSGVGGIVAQANNVLPDRGLYRSTNAFSGSPTWTRLQVTGTTSTNTISTSLVMDPSNANNIVVAYYGQAGTDPVGIYRSTDALAATPTFAQTKAIALAKNAKLAINKVGAVVTVYASTEEGSPNGRLYKSTDGGATWSGSLKNGWASSQGFYDIAVGLDPTNANNVSVGGSTSPNLFQKSTDGGATFIPSNVGLHADVHAIAYAPSNPAVIYHGNDGGIWKSTDTGLTWTSLNNGTFSATQFEGLAVHPIDRNFSIGGTQDNGTEHLKPDGTFYRADFGDGGYSLIDQNASDTNTVTSYHTYFNSSGSLIGTGRLFSAACLTMLEPPSGKWSFHGIYSGGVDTTTIYCDGTKDSFNGIALGDAVRFYAPQALGPGNPNTWYFGTNKLYRSTDSATNGAAVSQTLPTTVSAIAISPQDDNVRLAGLSNGAVFATTTGANPLLQIAGAGATNGTTTTPALGVGRMIVDPKNKAVAYLGFTGSALGVGHVWKTTNLNALPAGSVTWTPMSTGLPDVAVNAFAIDPDSAPLTGGSSQSIYVGTDAGVYYSSDAGATWSAYGMGMPHVSVFAMEIQNPNAILRAATHGRGIYDTTTALQFISASSRKKHGTGGSGTNYDIDMPLSATLASGTSGVECRTGGDSDGGTSGDYKIVFHFTNPLVAGTAAVSPANHNPAGGGGTAGTPTFSGTEMIVPLSGVTNGQVLTVQVSGVTDINGNVLAGPLSVNVGFLRGDTGGNRTVSASDISQTKLQSGVALSAANLREDVTHDGSISASDISTVKSSSGTAVP